MHPSPLRSSPLLGEIPVPALDDAHDDAKDAERRSKDLDDKDLDEEPRVLCVGQGARAAADADADPRGEVGQADADARPKEAVARELVLCLHVLRNGGRIHLADLLESGGG